MWGLEGPSVPTVLVLAWRPERARAAQGKQSPVLVETVCGEQTQPTLPFFYPWPPFFAKQTSGFFPTTLGEGCTSWVKATLSFHHIHLKRFFLSELGFVTLPHPLVKIGFCTKNGTVPSSS